MYDYRRAVENDVREWINDNIDSKEWTEDREGLAQYLNDTLWNEDSVTGNPSGSYYCNAWKAEEALNHNWEVLEEAADAFGMDPVITSGYINGPEYWDVTIRCYLLNSVIYDIMEEFEESGFFNE